jgi:uncharacterized protein (TIGR00375 family)
MSPDLCTDLHLHSCFSMASSRTMLPDQILAACETKGITCVGTGDALHPGWRALWEPLIGTGSDLLIVPTTEVEDANSVHHLILMPDFEAFAALGNRLSGSGKDILTTGRPHVRLPAASIASLVHACGGLIGPAHAFTPWTSLYGRFSNTREAYGDEEVDFLELGLSSDSSYAAGIPELASIPFLSNSDAHSPDPAKIGREFFGLKIRERSPAGVLHAIKAGQITMNAGFFPEEGKYNRTACSRCYVQYPLSEAMALQWRCPHDRGLIKKGVRDRALELSTGDPGERPPYLHIIPLGEIIQKVQKTCSTRTKACRQIYSRFISSFGNEIRVLTTVPTADLASVDERVATVIGSLRNNEVVLFPGGGGRYGHFSIPGIE